MKYEVRNAGREESKFFSAYHDPRFTSDGQERIMTALTCFDKDGMAAHKTMMSGKIRFYEKQSERYGHFIRSGE